MDEHVCCRCGDVVRGNPLTWATGELNGKRFELCFDCFKVFREFVVRHDVKGSD